MKFKLIMAMVQDEITDDVIKAAREAGATGCTVITSARGEGLVPPKTFLGLDLTGRRDMALFLVEEHLSRHILETIAEAGDFRGKPGSGIAFVMDIEDAVGLESQLQTIRSEIEEKL